jgi:diadenylate cyclase
MGQLLDLVKGFQIQPIAFLDVALTALLIYGLFSVIRGTRAVRLIIGVTVLYAIYVVAQALGLQLLSQILQAGAVLGLLALVVVFQPELRRALERIGRVGSLGWLLAPGTHSTDERVARIVAQAAASMATEKIGALMVIERETGLQDMAEAGVMLDAALSVDLLGTIFTPHAPLHDGAVVIRHENILSAGVVLPLSDSGAYRERFGTRHRAALGITEQTDAVAVVVSEETGAMSLVERGHIARNLDEERLRRGLLVLLDHNQLSAARLPARASALRRTLPIGRRARPRRRGEARAESHGEAGNESRADARADARPETGSGTRSGTAAAHTTGRAE